jgi:hypothetical protein
LLFILGVVENVGDFSIIKHKSNYPIIMRLNLPHIEEISNCQNLLIAGAGGGFDIFCGLPIYWELTQQKQTIHLANLSFSNAAFYPLDNFSNFIRLSDTLVGVTVNNEELPIYFPEFHLVKWFWEKYEQKITIWCFKRKGFQSLFRDYQILVKYLSIDGILLIDGGVDTLICGNEKEMGTFVEDSLSIAAVSLLKDIPVKLLACTGFGAERQISYHQILENIAYFSKLNGFLGSCSLVKNMQCYQNYQEAVLYVQSIKGQDSSVINSSIISAVQGNYGNYHLTKKTEGSILSISPLMTIYWFFQLEIIAKHNTFLKLFLDKILTTKNFIDVMIIGRQFLRDRQKRSIQRPIL